MIALDALFEQNFENREMLWKYIIDYRLAVGKIFEGITTVIELYCRYSKYVNNFELLGYIPIDIFFMRDSEAAHYLMQCFAYLNIEEEWKENFRAPIYSIMRKYLETSSNGVISFIQIVDYCLHVLVYNIMKPSNWIFYMYV